MEGFTRRLQTSYETDHCDRAVTIRIFRRPLNLGEAMLDDLELHATATCGKFFKAETGELSLSHGRLRFVVLGTAVFDTSFKAIEKITWHWYSFSGAFEATIEGTNYFLSFVPRNAQLGGSWSSGLRTGRQWRAAFEGRTIPISGPIMARIFLVLMRVVVFFLLGCFAIITFSQAIDPHRSNYDAIMFGWLPALVCIGQLVLMVIQGFIDIRDYFRA